MRSKVLGLAVFGEPMEDRLADGAKIDLTFRPDFGLPSSRRRRGRDQLRAAGTANGAMSSPDAGLARQSCRSRQPVL